MSETTSVRPIRTFHPRRGRMSTRHATAMAEMWPAYGLTVVDGDRTPLDLKVLFGRDAPRILEIGFGMGDATAAMAAADPDRDYLAVEVHTPGIGNLLALVRDWGLINVRVAQGDAMQLVHRLKPASLDAVHIFFPDPWPKARHHKRRLIQPGNVAMLRSVLRPGGVVHCATDWPEYAAAMAEVLAGDPGLTEHDPAPVRMGEQSKDTPGPAPVRMGEQSKDTPGPAPVRMGEQSKDRPGPAPVRMGEQSKGGDRPMTRFERRGIDAGRPIVDLVYQRR